MVSNLSANMPSGIQKVIVAFEGSAHYPYQAKVVLLNIPLSTNFLSKAYMFLLGCREFQKVLKQENPDYVVSLGSITSIINLFSSRKAVVRIGNPITKGHERWSERAYPLLVRLFFNRAKKIIVISKGSKHELIKNFRIKEDKIALIYNFIDEATTQTLAQEPLPDEYEEIFKHPVIINVANLVEQKGQEYLIRSFSLLKGKVKNAKLVFIGKGHLEPKLKKIVENLGLQKDVHFLGWQKNPFKFIARSKVFALPSLWEGFGIVILEAMACGTPVVAFDCPFGPKEILAPELDINTSIQEIHFASCGVLVPTGQEDYLANAISSVIEDQSLRHHIIYSAAKRVKEFTMEKFLNGYQFLWE